MSGVAFRFCAIQENDHANAAIFAFGPGQSVIDIDQNWTALVTLVTNVSRGSCTTLQKQGT
jgi:hypothetical protein